MGIEVERKFLLVSDEWRPAIASSTPFQQGYLSSNPQVSVRVRIEGEQANLNIKGMNLGIQRLEYEYPIDLADAKELLAQLCATPQIHKIRHIVYFAGKTWEIDEFLGDNAGLIVAEVELLSADETITLPAWVGQEVSNMQRYYNISLTQYPFCQWNTAEQSGSA